MCFCVCVLTFTSVSGVCAHTQSHGCGRQEVKAHTDGIRSMCMKEDCVVTGPGSSDGVVAIWDPTQLSR